jgi:hypothetical protein
MKRIVDIVKQVRSLPKVSITLSREGKVGKELYANFMKRHPRLFLVRKKTIGVGLVDLAIFDNAK